jgi:hypothetical protein
MALIESCLVEISRRRRLVSNAFNTDDLGTYRLSSAWTVIAVTALPAFGRCLQQYLGRRRSCAPEGTAG